MEEVIKRLEKELSSKNDQIKELNEVINRMKNDMKNDNHFLYMKRQLLMGNIHFKYIKKNFNLEMEENDNYINLSVNVEDEKINYTIYLDVPDNEIEIYAMDLCKLVIEKYLSCKINSLRKDLFDKITIKIKEMKYNRYKFSLSIEGKASNKDINLGNTNFKIPLEMEIKTVNNDEVFNYMIINLILGNNMRLFDIINTFNENILETLEVVQNYLVEE